MAIAGEDEAEKVKKEEKNFFLFSEPRRRNRHRKRKGIHIRQYNRTAQGSARRLSEASSATCLGRKKKKKKRSREEVVDFLSFFLLPAACSLSSLSSSRSNRPSFFLSLSKSLSRREKAPLYRSGPLPCYVRAQRPAGATELRRRPERIRRVWRRWRSSRRRPGLPRSGRRLFVIIHSRPDGRRWGCRRRRGQGEGPDPPRHLLGQVEEPAREGDPGRGSCAFGEFFFERGWDRLIPSVAPPIFFLLRLLPSSRLFFCCDSLCCDDTVSVFSLQQPKKGERERKRSGERTAREKRERGTEFRFPLDASSRKRALKIWRRALAWLSLSRAFSRLSFRVSR